MIIEVYNKKELLPDDRELLDDCEAYFPMFVSVADFQDKDYYALKQIDGATLIDTRLKTIQTPFGVTDIYKISSGCKTVLIYLALLRRKDVWGKKYSLDITECGYNALNVLFALANLSEISIPFLLRHGDVVEVEEFEFLFNGREKGSELYDLRFCD